MSVIFWIEGICWYRKYEGAEMCLTRDTDLIERLWTDGPLERKVRVTDYLRNKSYSSPIVGGDEVSWTRNRGPRRQNRLHDLRSLIHLLLEHTRQQESMKVCMNFVETKPHTSSSCISSFDNEKLMVFDKRSQRVFKSERGCCRCETCWFRDFFTVMTYTKMWSNTMNV